jgi:hypothetical protein
VLCCIGWLVQMQHGGDFEEMLNIMFSGGVGTRPMPKPSRKHSAVCICTFTRVT